MFGTVVVGFLSLGIRTATYKYFFQFRVRKKDKIFKSLNFTNLVFIIFIFCIFYFPVSLFADEITFLIFKKSFPSNLLSWSYLYGCIEHIFTYCTLLLMADKKAGKLSLVVTLRVILDVAISFYCIYIHKMTFDAKIIGLLTSYATSLVIILFMVRNLFSLAFSVRLLKKSIFMTAPTLLSGVIGVVQSSFDKIYLGRFHSLTNIGYYNFGSKFAGVFQLVHHSIQKVWGPFFHEMIHSKKEGAHQYIVKRYFTMVYFLMCCGFLIIYFSEELIRIFTTKAYYPSMYIAPLFIYNFLIGLLCELSINQLQVGEKLIYQFPTSVAEVSINIVLNIILIPRYGAVGAILATLSSSIVTDLLLFYYGNKAISLPVPKVKLFNMYMIFFLGTLPAFYLIDLEIDFISKFMIKLSAFLGFVIIGFWFQWFEVDELKARLGRLRYG